MRRMVGVRTGVGRLVIVLVAAGALVSCSDDGTGGDAAEATTTEPPTTMAAEPPATTTTTAVGDADCVDPAAGPVRDGVDEVVTVYLFCGSGTAPPDLRPVDRVVPRSAASVPLTAALDQLFIGVTPREAASGLGSAYSPYTAGEVRGVSIDGPVATIDLGPGFESANNFSTSSLSAVVLAQLEATVFQFPEIDGIELRVDGQRFCGWENFCDGVPTPLISRQ